MVANYLYSPILKGKANDLKAFSQLSPEARALSRPLAEILPVPVDVSVDEHLEKFVHNLIKYGNTGDALVDFYGLLPGEETIAGLNAIIAGLRLLRAKGYVATPTYGFDRDDSTWPLLRNEIPKMGKGFCFRIDIDDLDDQAEDSWAQLVERSAELAISPTQTDLLIDLRFIGDKDRDVLKDLVIDFLSYLPVKSQYRSIIIAGSSAPKTVVKIPQDGVGDVARNELRLWMEVQSELAGIRVLTFGDYGVVNPDFSDIGPNPNANAKIRYTVSGKIAIYRGHKLFNPSDFKQYHAIADRVRSGPDFIDSDFSIGDAYIHDCADGNTGPGNLGTWVFVDMNHHMEYSAKQQGRIVEKAQTGGLSTDEIDELVEAV